jgi:hypothetical protein
MASIFPVYMTATIPAATKKRLPPTLYTAPAFPVGAVVDWLEVAPVVVAVPVDEPLVAVPVEVAEPELDDPVTVMVDMEPLEEARVEADADDALGEAVTVDLMVNCGV